MYRHLFVRSSVTYRTHYCTAACCCSPAYSATHTNRHNNNKQQCISAAQLLLVMSSLHWSDCCSDTRMCDCGTAAAVRCCCSPAYSAIHKQQLQERQKQQFNQQNRVMIFSIRPPLHNMLRAECACCTAAAVHSSACSFRGYRVRGSIDRT